MVSFSTYLTPQQTAVALDGLPVSAVVARVPLPGRQTELVRIAALRLPGDVVAGMAQVADRKDREAADYRARAAAPAAAADPDLRRVYASGAQVSAAEAAAYRTACACVYAALVRGPAARLRALAARLDVRAVDPAGAGAPGPDGAHPAAAGAAGRGPPTRRRRPDHPAAGGRFVGSRTLGERFLTAPG
ncbi:hypothetical protein [Micromonospora sp. R77]|uniref:hypothetical protein n=1 Tax=Micromonospora sp. R77 TaxID=2925836 RepID=UPI0035B289B5